MYDSQATTLDNCGIPFTVDAWVGVIVGEKREGVGDGRWYYKHTRDGFEVCERKRPYPYDAHVERQTLALAKCRESIRNPPKIAPSSPLRAETCNTISKKDTRPCKPRTGAETCALLSRCTIYERARGGSGRVDYTIVTPDGHTFRSKRSALAHMNCV